jgi:hypothetical protein
MFLKIGVRKLGLKSGKGLDFLNSEIAMRRAAGAAVWSSLFE